jgi:cyanate lyase
MIEQELAQQEFLQAAKTALGMAWEELAKQAGTAPRAVEQLLGAHAKETRKKAA